MRRMGMTMNSSPTSPIPSLALCILSCIATARIESKLFLTFVSISYPGPVFDTDMHVSFRPMLLKYCPLPCPFALSASTWTFPMTSGYISTTSANDNVVTTYGMRVVGNS